MSTRQELIRMKPGDKRHFTTSSIKVSYLRCLASTLKRDLARNYSVHVQDHTQGVVVTRIV